MKTEVRINKDFFNNIRGLYALYFYKEDSLRVILEGLSMAFGDKLYESLDDFKDAKIYIGDKLYTTDDLRKEADSINHDYPLFEKYRKEYSKKYIESLEIKDSDFIITDDMSLNFIYFSNFDECFKAFGYNATNITVYETQRKNPEDYPSFDEWYKNEMASRAFEDTPALIYSPTFDEFYNIGSKAIMITHLGFSMSSLAFHLEPITDPDLLAKKRELLTKLQTTSKPLADFRRNNNYISGLGIGPLEYKEMKDGMKNEE